MNTIKLIFVYYPEDGQEPVVVTEASSLIVPRIGETIVLNPEEAEEDGVPGIWDVVDLLYALPRTGSDTVVNEVTVCIVPGDDEEDEE
jgi:hypothetical protein